ncbi:hypothetical protein M8J76_008012 [Diaphorina citri]|nr:hypothetical protein M8J75_007175 [Diaphorina citri]KAI5726763.1 hypothetical protein M8J76_008012 [Diaphorina citri]KAI5730868.1 hypothetical protein M8J77_001140 [Diaphorina citri]
MTIDFISFAYAATVAAGGIIGYVKAGSVPSLGAGLVFGGILGYGAYQTTKNPNNFYLTLGTSAVLAGIMGHRYYNTRKFMPPGLITVLSVAMILRFTAQGVYTLVSEQPPKNQ